MIKFPSIEQYRNVIRNVKERTRFTGLNADGTPTFSNAALPTLTYRGTTKIHGTNAAIAYSPEYQEFTYQSRNRILTAEYDQYNFVKTMQPIEPQLSKLMYEIVRQLPHMPERVTIFGEWCGEGIQKKVAVSELSRRFVYFAVRITYTEEHQEWFDIDNIKGQYHELATNVLEYGYHLKHIDFNYPEIAQNELIKLTEAVEAKCPVGKYYGVSGVGEGIVWTCITPGWESSKFWMKIKGEKHSASKVKTLAAVDVEAAASMRDFIENTVTEARLEQAYDYLVEMGRPLDMTSTGEFIRWVYNDLIKEESDTMQASGIDPRKLGSAVSNKARPWFFGKVNNA